MMPTRTQQRLLAAAAVLLACCAGARALEAHEVSHDLADLPGGLLMKQRLEERVASMAVGAATGRAARPASGKLVDELLKQAGTVAAGAFDLASAVAAAVGAGDEDGAAAAPTPPPPKMLETRSHEVDVAVPDPSAPQPQMQPMPDPAPATPAAPAQPAQPAERQKVDALGSTTQPKPKPKDPKSSGARAPAAPAAKPPAAKPPTTPATKTPAAPASKAPAAPASKAPATPAAKAPAPPSPPKAPKAPTYDAFPAEPWKGYTLPPYELKEPRVVGLADLKPTIGAKRGHKYYYQIPDNPRAVLLLIHGCAHSGANWFPQGPACEECRPLPEQLSHTVQALRRNYAVVSFSSLDQASGCWAWWDDCYSVRDTLEDWLTENKLVDLPLYGLGVSSGAAFALKLARFFHMDGVMSEALGIEESAWGLTKVEGAYPPTVFVSMERDEQQRAKIQGAYDVLKRRGSPVAVVKSYPRKVYSTYFSDRSPLGISDSLSRKVVSALKEIGMLDDDGTVKEDPRYTMRPWMSQLKDKVPELKGHLVSELGRAVPQFPPLPDDMNSNAVWSLMNLAYNKHEIISDYATAAFLWWESGGKADLRKLLEGNTFSRGPPLGSTRRSTLEAAPTSRSAAGSGLSADARAATLAQAGDLEAAAAEAEAALRAAGPARFPGLGQFGRGTLSGAAAVLLVGGVAWLALRQRAGRQGEGLMAGAMQAGHPTPALHQPHLPSIIPGVRERFPELTEVVEQTGSPFSARRRARTAFHPDAPLRSPTKRHSQAP